MLVLFHVMCNMFKRPCTQFRKINAMHIIFSDKSGHTKRYKVVAFADENTVAAVPSVWLRKDDTVCYWPNEGSVSEMARKCAAIDAQFDGHKVKKVLYETGAYCTFVEHAR